MLVPFAGRINVIMNCAVLNCTLVYCVTLHVLLAPLPVLHNKIKRLRGREDKALLTVYWLLV